MKKICSLLCAPLCALALLAAAPASAALINHHDGTFSDTATGYLWRTLAQYDGMRFADAAALLPPAYHIASETELATLTTAAPAGDLAALLASMGATPGSGIAWGFYGGGDRYAWLADGDVSWNSNAANEHGWTNWNYGVGADDAFAGLSLFAVNSAPAPVPEPGPLALLAAGLAALVAGRWRARPA